MFCSVCYFPSIKSNCGFCSSRISAADFHGENLTESTFHNFFLKFDIPNLRIEIGYILSSGKNMKQNQFPEDFVKMHVSNFLNKDCEC